ncbi:MAG: DUF3592 domain-containing protein [Chloroflexota bacterium]
MGIFGLVFFVIGLGIWYFIGYGAGNLPFVDGYIDMPLIDLSDPDEAWIIWLQYLMGGGFALLGAFFMLLQVRINYVKNAVQPRIMKHGVEAQARITLISGSPFMTVNHQPTSYIIEYAYRDANGNTHVSQVTEPVEKVARSGFKVNTIVTIKYLPDNPEKSVILFPDLTPRPPDLM